MSIRKLLFWTHLACGVIAGIVILVMSATGVLLTYQREMTAWFDIHAYRTEPPLPGAARLQVTALAAGVAAMTGAEGPVSVTVRSDPTAPASVAVGQRTLFVNAYTGALLGEGAPGVRRFFRRVTDWHRWLGASTENRAAGRMITGVSNVAFLIIVATGPFLWWPRKLTVAQVRNVAWFKRGLPSKARDFNWHNTIGIWSAIPLLVIAGSGVVMSYPWANNLVYRFAGEQPPAQGRSGAPLDSRRPEEAARGHDGNPSIPSIDVVARAAEERPAWRTITVRVPQPWQRPIAVTVDEGDGGQPQKRGTLTLDPQTGTLVKWESQAGTSAGRRARSWLRFAHTGEVYGLTGQTIAGLASLGGVVLVWTGLALAVRRVVSWRPRTVKDLVPAITRLESE